MDAPETPAGPPPPAVIRTPREIDLELTSRCNLRCRYCYYFDNPAVPYEDLPTAEWLRFFEELERCAVMRVTLQGGEPFMRPDLRELISSIVSHHMRFSILTNGTQVDDAIAAFLARSNRCDYVQVSIDGSSPGVHDLTRGAGSFERAVNGIRALQAHGVRVVSRVTITRHNVHDLEQTARFLLEDLALPEIGTNSACVLGSCRVRADELLLDTASRMAAMRTLTALAERYPGRVVASAGPLADARTWAGMELARAEKAAGFNDGGRLTGCGCHMTKIAVRADGAMVPCVMLAHLEMGRINHDALEAVWQNSPVLADLRSRFNVPLTDFEHCTGCPYTPYCTGNCPALAYSLYGKVNHPSPDGCLRLFLKEGGRLDRPMKGTP